jgi:hypothetical protein
VSGLGNTSWTASCALEKQAPNRAVAHARYQYHCLIVQCSGGLQIGVDQYIFRPVVCRGAEWQVTRMAGYMSARFLSFVRP